ncbi:MAG: GTP-binding protein engA [Gammaproteobacteria bacterium]|jgi:GTP-binding protein|nr:GTP-binding protein engA [Gammaproteobacteria bacterium]
MTIPTIALIGRPNVGKSTLFNYLTRSRAALVADEPGVTRDRQYGEGLFESKPFIVIDTGGMEKNKDPLQTLMHDQAMRTLQEADIVFWLVDAKAGLTATEDLIAKQLRTRQQPVYLLVNKTDGIDPDVAASDFYSLGFKAVFPIAAVQGRGVSALMKTALAEFITPENESDASQNIEEESLDSDILPEDLSIQETNIKVAIIGKPNVGKSTLINRLLGEERVIVYDAPGTTRDSIFIPFERRGQQYTLIDTAGVRRKRSIDNALEKFSVVKTLQAVSQANVVILVISARENITEQDLHLLGYILESGRSLIIAVNKWDGLSERERAAVKQALDRRLRFVEYAHVEYISALHGTAVGHLFPLIQQVYDAAMRPLSTSELTNILIHAVESHQPPAVSGRRIKLRYAHPGGSNPPVIVIHGNQTDALPESYRRYLAKMFREALSLVGTPVRIVLKTGKNPYEREKNVLTDRQKKRRERLIKHVKKK